MNFAELKSRFISFKKLKNGGQKMVYKGTCRDGRIVAVKIINNFNDRRILQEIKLLKEINLKNVPKIIENGLVLDEIINEERLYIIEEYIDGISFREWLNMHNRAKLKDAYHLLNSLISIEIELEKMNIIHRDIKPDNIILAQDGTIYLIDFGLAKIRGGVSLTLTEAVQGPFTPGYAPHEQFSNDKIHQDTRTDLFQIGVTLYELCTGENPFIEGCLTIEDIKTKTMCIKPRILELAGDTKGQLAQFIDILMAKNPSQRPDSALEAMRYLKAIKPTLRLEV